eukprot:scaffold175_cov414-Prasinococcus_capsulatus_cf.AAC.7
MEVGKESLICCNPHITLNGEPPFVPAPTRLALDAAFDDAASNRSRRPNHVMNEITGRLTPIADTRTTAQHAADGSDAYIEAAPLPGCDPGRRYWRPRQPLERCERVGAEDAPGLLVQVRTLDPRSAPQTARSPQDGQVFRWGRQP